ncbi:MAG TPA: AAA family ATPase [Patescibacteria group bacterium]|jgi:cytidylate kinase|nr:AAA family ATPase [Patescibacteria group bacterium]
MDKKLQIIGLAGTNGSGKDTVGALLAEHYNFWFFSLTELFREECRRRAIPITRENTRMISAQWRRESGLATLVDRSMAAFDKVGGLNKYVGVVMSSLRNPYEPDRIHELGGTVIWIDADPKIRYERIQTNAATRGRAGEDNKTYQQFLQEEQDEMHPPKGADETALNVAAVKERADIFITNNEDKLEILLGDLKNAIGL